MTEKPSMFMKERHRLAKYPYIVVITALIITALSSLLSDPILKKIRRLLKWS